MPLDALPEVNQRSRDLIALCEARERIARGWCRYHLFNAGAVCSVGALINARVSRFTDLPREDYRLACERAGLLGLSLDDLVEWNDVPGRTQAEVLARFDEAIQLLASQG